MSEVKAESRVLRITNGIFSFPYVFKKRPPMEMKGLPPGKAKYEITLLLDPTTSEHKACIDKLIKAAYAAAKSKELPITGTAKDEEGNDKPFDRIKQFYNGVELEKFTMPFAKGERKKDSKTGAVLGGYAGKVYVTARTEIRPGVVDRLMAPLTEEDGKIYGGAVGNMSIDVYAWKNAAKFGIGIDLRGVQFVKDGTAFGRAPVRVEDEFEALEAEAGAGDSSGAEWD